jgi:hypothetical protein
MIRLVAALLLMAPVAHAETCRFAGTTSYDGRLVARTETTQVDDILTLDVTVEFAAHAWMTDYRYFGQEITTWSVGDGQRAALRSVAVNQRSLADGSIKRQQWDVFTRNGPRLEGYRVQAKRLVDFQQRHPGFVSHWSPASFGQPWLADFRHAGAERRPDLDPWSSPASSATSRPRSASAPPPPVKAGTAGPLRCATRRCKPARCRWPRPGCRLTTGCCSSASTSTRAGPQARRFSTRKDARASRSAPADRAGHKGRHGIAGRLLLVAAACLVLPFC